MGIRRCYGRRTGPFKHTSTSKRWRCLVKLCASNERLTASYTTQSRVSLDVNMGSRHGGGKGSHRSDSTDAHNGGEFKLNIGDDREFPSLSGAPQAQQNTSAQQMWSNPTLRTATQPQQTIGRPQGQGPQQGQSGQTSNQQLQNQGLDDNQSQFSGAGDDYRFGGQGGVGQLSGGAQPQTTNIEEFPPLGGAAGEIGPDRRAGLIQSAAAFGGNANSSAFPGLGQTRNSIPSPTESQQERTLNPTVGGRGLPGAGELVASLAVASSTDDRPSLTHTVRQPTFDTNKSARCKLGVRL